MGRFALVFDTPSRDHHGLRNDPHGFFCRISPFRWRTFLDRVIEFTYEPCVSHHDMEGLVDGILDIEGWECVFSYSFRYSFDDFALYGSQYFGVYPRPYLRGGTNNESLIYQGLNCLLRSLLLSVCYAFCLG